MSAAAVSRQTWNNGPMDRAALLTKLQSYKFFFHTIDLGDGVTTPGYPIPLHKYLVMEAIASLVPGKEVLDVGCANGLFSFHAEKCGASRVLAVDNMERELEPMKELLIPHLKSKVETKLANVLDLSPVEIGRFEVVVCAGLLYHLRYPFWSLRIIRDLMVDGGMLILETAVWVDNNRHALLHCPAQADYPYGPESLSCTFFNIKGLVDTLAAFGLKVVSLRHTTPKVRAILQATARLVSSYVPIRRVIAICELNLSAADPDFRFYEGTLPSTMPEHQAVQDPAAVAGAEPRIIRS